MICAPFLPSCEHQVRPRLFFLRSQMRGKRELVDNVASGYRFDLSDLNLGRFHRCISKPVPVLTLSPQGLVVEHARVITAADQRHH
jgi:hypothetical protein